jgi:hypothetical protein
MKTYILQNCSPTISPAISNAGLFASGFPFEVCEKNRTVAYPFNVVHSADLLMNLSVTKQKPYFS